MEFLRVGLKTLNMALFPFWQLRVLHDNDLASTTQVITLLQGIAEQEDGRNLRLYVTTCSRTTPVLWTITREVNFAQKSQSHQVSLL